MFKGCRTKKGLTSAWCLMMLNDNWCKKDAFKLMCWTNTESHFATEIFRPDLLRVALTDAKPGHLEAALTASVPELLKIALQEAREDTLRTALTEADIPLLAIAVTKVTENREERRMSIIF